MATETASSGPDVQEAVLDGSRQLRQAFLEEPIQAVPRGKDVWMLNSGQPGAFLVEGGLGYRAYAPKNGPRVILDLLIPGDIVGLEHLYTRQPNQSIVAASDIKGHMLPTACIRQLLSRQPLYDAITALILEARARADQLNVMLASMPARERIVAMFLCFYYRLRRRQFIQGPSFNFPLTQEEIGDHLGLTVEHVNRVLRRLREEKLLVVDRGVVILRNIRHLHKLVDDLWKIDCQ